MNDVDDLDVVKELMKAFVLALPGVYAALSYGCRGYRSRVYGSQMGCTHK